MAQFIQTQYEEFVNLDNVLTFNISYNEEYKVCRCLLPRILYWKSYLYLFYNWCLQN